MAYSNTTSSLNHTIGQSSLVAAAEDATAIPMITKSPSSGNRELADEDWSADDAPILK